MVVGLRSVDEAVITSSIIRKATEDLLNHVNSDVIVAGAGPSGLVAAKYLAEAGLKSLVFERKFSFGGGIGGGGMQFHKVVIQSPAEKISEEVGCKLEPIEKNIFIVDTSDLIAKLASGAINAGAKIILGITVEDLVYRSDPNPRIVGVVVQWSPIILSGLHVDPMAFKSKAVIDCTGHDAEVLTIASRKIPELNIQVTGEKSMWASSGENLVVENTKEICDGLYAAGLAVSALHKTPRMGPIFGGMLLSGKKIAELIIEKLE